MKEKTTYMTSIRLTDSMHKFLSEEAEKQSRPLANYIKAILIEHMEAKKRIEKIERKE